MLLDPSDSLAYVTYAAEFSEQQSKRALMIAELRGLELAEKRANFWRTKQGGKVLWTSIGGPLTGAGFRRVFVDDPVKGRAEAESSTYRDAAWDWFNAVAYTRLEPGGSVVVMATRWHCLLPSARVATISGPMAIADVCAGVEVLTSAGMQPVAAAATKHHSGDVVSIRTFGNPDVLECTTEHQLLTQRGWVRADEVTIADWLVHPRELGAALTDDELRAMLPAAPVPRASTRRPPKRRVTARTVEWCERISTAKSVVGFARMQQRVSPTRLEELIRTGRTYDEIAPIVGLPNKAAVHRYATRYGIRPPSATVVTGDPMVSPAFWRVVGYWIAEGTITSGRRSACPSVVRFSFGPTEQHLVDDVRTAMAPFGIDVRQQTRPHALVASFSSPQIAAFLASRFGLGAHGKRIDEPLIRLPEAHARELIRGLVEGDGCIGRGWARLTSVSAQLLDGVRRILVRAGVPTWIMRGVGTKREVRFRVSDAAWMRDSGKASRVVALPARRRIRSMRIDGASILHRVKRIERRRYDGPVYDLQTPAHDFVAAGVIVHNCDDLSGRLIAQGWPVINLPALSDDGRALWPERYPASELAKIREQIGEYEWASLYQGQPRSKGGRVFGDVHFYEKLPEAHYRVVVGVDLAYTSKKHSDYSVAVALAEHQGTYYVVDVVRVQEEAPRFFDRMLQLQRTWPGARFIWHASTTERGLSDMMSSHGLNISAELASSIGDKFARAQPIAAAWNAGKVLVRRDAPWASTFVSEMAAFTGINDRHDDQVDAAASAFSAVVHAGAKQASVKASVGSAGRWNGMPSRGF